MKIAYSRLSTKGQIVIPLEIREALRLSEGTRVALHVTSGAVVMQPITENFIDSIPGFLGQGRGLSLSALREREKAAARS